MRFSLIVGTLILSIFTIPPVTRADRETLQRIEELAVHIEDLPADVTSVGLSASQLRTDTELALRMAGMVVSNGAQSYLLVRVEGLPVKDQSEKRLLGFTYKVSVEFKQKVIIYSALAVFEPDSETRTVHCFCVDRSADNRQLTLKWRLLDREGTMSNAGYFPEGATRLATTWETGAIAIVGTAGDPRASIRQDVKDLVSEFINAFFAARQDRELWDTGTGSHTPNLH